MFKTKEIEKLIEFRETVKKIKPSEEKIYLANYPEGAANTVLPKMKLDEYFLEVNGKDLERTGLIFTPTNEHIAIGKMIEEYNKTVKSLIGLGLEPGDNVAVSLLNVPEMLYTILACSKLGLTINMINPTASPEITIKRINSLKPKLLIAQDKTAALFENIKNYINVPYIITAPVVDGYTNVGIKPLDSSIGFWNDFISNGRYTTKSFEVPYDDKSTFIYTHSSGSTGPSKPIELGHDTFTHTGHMHSVAGLDFEPGDLWLATIPGLFSTGINSSIILPLLIKMATILEPNYDRKVFLNNIIKFMPRAAIATKFFWKGMLEDPAFNGIDLSYLRCGVIGGEKVRRHESRRFDDFLESHNNYYGLCNGYGQCELGGGIGSSCTNKRTKGNNTIGFPYTHNTIIIRDLKTGEEVDYNQRGEITAETTTAMFRYYGMEEETKEYFKNGRINLGDIGYVNKNGEYFVDGRVSDFIQLSEDLKIYPYEIEDIIEDILENDKNFDRLIKDYCIYGAPNDDFEMTALQIHISEEDIDQAEIIIKTLNKKINDRLPIESRISLYKARVSPFPATDAGKTKTSDLKEETDGFMMITEKEEIKQYTLKPRKKLENDTI